MAGKRFVNRPQFSRFVAMNEKQKTTPPEETPSFPRIAGMLITLSALFLAAQIIVTYLVDTTRWRIWGVNFASFLKGDIAVIILTVLPVAFLFPAMLKRYQMASGLGDKKKPPSKGMLPALKISGFVLAIAVAVLLLPVAYPFLGDGASYTTDLFRVIHVKAHASVLIKATSSLMGYLIVGLTKLLRPADLTVPYVIVGLLSAAILVLLFAALRKRDSRLTVWLAAILFGGSAGSLMFFGYVELYALQYAFTIGFFLTGWHTLRRRSGIWLPTTMLLLAVAAGAYALIYVPAWVFLVYASGKNQPDAARLPRLALLLCGIILATLIAAYVFTGTGGNAYLIPLLSTESTIGGISHGVARYTMFSPAHLADILNALALNAIAPLLLLAALLIVDRRRMAWSAPATVFALIAAVAGIVALLAGNSDFGLGRDWDATAIFALPVTFLAFVFAMQLLENRALGLLLPLLLVVQCSFLGRWILVNHDGPASAQRMAALVDMNASIVLPQYTQSGRESLRQYAVGKADYDALLRVTKSMWSTGYEPMKTLTHLLGAIQVLPDSVRRATEFRGLIATISRRLHERIPERRYDHADPASLQDFLTRTLIIAAHLGHEDVVEQALVELQTSLPEWKGEPFYRAVSNEEIRSVEAAFMAEQALRPDCRDPLLLEAMGRLWWTIGRYDYACIAYRKAIAADDTGFPGMYLTLARLYDQELNKRDSTVVWLLACAEKCKLTKEAKQAEQILTEQLNIPLPE
jgi:hypothetical protein